MFPEMNYRITAEKLYEHTCAGCGRTVTLTLDEYFFVEEWGGLGLCASCDAGDTTEADNRPLSDEPIEIPF